MYLKRILLSSYGVLRNFSLSLTDSHHSIGTPFLPVNLLIGDNGAGKSTLLRAIFETFYRLRQNTRFGYLFEIEYYLSDTPGAKTVLISNHSEKHTVEAWVDGVPVADYSVFLPEQITGVCTTGDFSPWARLYSNDVVIDGVHCFSPISLPAIVLGAATSPNFDQVLHIANSPLRQIVGFSIEVLGVPAIRSVFQSPQFQALKQCATRAIHQPGHRLLLVFDLVTPECFERLTQSVGGGTSLVHFLNGLLSEAVKLHVFGQSQAGVMLQLSDLGTGQKRLLELLSLFRLYANPNSLLLVDDLDAYLDDVVLRSLMFKFEQLNRGTAFQAWFATNSIIPVSDLPSTSTFHLKRGDFYTSEANSLSIPTFAGNWTDFLCYLHQLPHANGEWSTQQIKLAIAQAEAGDPEYLNNLISVTSGYWNYFMRRHQMEPT